MSPKETKSRPLATREAEQKFRIHGLFHLPDLRAIAGITEVDDLGTTELVSAYFDTEDLRLAREGITLRRRTGSDEGWHLKVPANPSTPDVRTELRLPLAESDGEPPRALLDIVRVVVRTADVIPVATLHTERSAVLLRASDGHPIAELVDDTVQVAGPDGTTTARFRELELEERAGGKAMARVADALTDAGAVSGEFVAKAVRALGPAAAGPPEVPAPEPPRPKDPAIDTVTAYLAKQVRALRAADIAFRSGPAESAEPTEPVHQLRVSARRLRSALRTFRPLLDTDWSKQLRAELAWFARGLGELREGEVLAVRLREHAGSLPVGVSPEPVVGFLDGEFDAAVARARENAVDILDSDRYLELHERLVEAALDPPARGDAAEPARQVLPGLVKKAWKRLSTRADQLRTDSTAEEWHRVRLLAKRARYAGEAVVVPFGDPAKAFARQMERLTDLLGEHQDAAQAAALLHEMAARAEDHEVVFALGALATVEHDHALAARAEFAEIWPEVRRPKWRTWLSDG